MNFSELFKQTNQICHYSPDGKHLVIYFSIEFIVKDVVI